MSTAQRVLTTIDSLRQENTRLKTQVTNLKHQLSDVQRQLEQYTKQGANSVKNISDLNIDRTSSKPASLVSNTTIETNINKNDARNALMAKLMRSKTSPNVLTAAKSNTNSMCNKICITSIIIPK